MYNQNIHNVSDYSLLLGLIIVVCVRTRVFNKIMHLAFAESLTLLFFVHFLVGFYMYK